MSLAENNEVFLENSEVPCVEAQASMIDRTKRLLNKLLKKNSAQAFPDESTLSNINNNNKSANDDSISIGTPPNDSLQTKLNESATKQYEPSHTTAAASHATLFSIKEMDDYDQDLLNLIAKYLVQKIVTRATSFHLSQSGGDEGAAIVSSDQHKLESTAICLSNKDLVNSFALNLHRIEKDVTRCDRNYWYFASNTNLVKLKNVVCS